MLCLCGSAWAKKTKPPVIKEKGVKFITGLGYKFHLDVPGRTATVNDVVRLHFVLRNSSDSVLRNTMAENRPVISTIQKSRFSGSFEQGLQMLSAGDSCSFWVLADSLFAKGIGAALPEYIAKGSYLRFDVKMLDVWTMQEYSKEQQLIAMKARVDEDKVLADYIKTNNIPATFDPATGLYYQVVKAGEGPKPIKGNTVSVHYTGRLLNGQIFDSSEGGQPFEFALGQGYVIEGWDKGIPYMKKGEKGILYIPSYMGYAGQRAGSIPPNSILIFEVELVNIK